MRDPITDDGDPITMVRWAVLLGLIPYILAGLLWLALH